jgi:hypothetical protein
MRPEFCAENVKGKDLFVEIVVEEGATLKWFLSM